VLVFTRTKHGANKVAKQLNDGGVRADAIHGNKSQSARERALDDFKGGRIRALVATDIAARGIDVDDVTHVINYDLPNEPESYVHRIGRTARAGASGIAISFCDLEERPYLRDIEKLIRLRVPVVDNHPYAGNANAAPPPKQERGPRPPREGRAQNGQSSRGGGQPAPRTHAAPAAPKPASRPQAQPAAQSASRGDDDAPRRRRRRRSGASRPA
nr:ATP-dependent helicase [Anaerolineae bacterium]